MILALFNPESLAAYSTLAFIIIYPSALNQNLASNTDVLRFMLPIWIIKIIYMEATPRNGLAVKVK
jgi:hypothetical protein